MSYYGFHILGFVASLIYLYLVFPKYGVKRVRGMSLAACTYLTAYALMLVLFWLVTGRFGGQNVIRVFLFLPLILWLYANTFGVDYKVSLDFAAPVLCIAQAFGKIGCTISGCCESWWQLSFGVYNPYTETRLFPVQIAEGITALAIAITVIWIASRKNFCAGGKTMAWMWVMFCFRRRQIASNDRYANGIFLCGVSAHAVPVRSDCRLYLHFAVTAFILGLLLLMCVMHELVAKKRQLPNSHLRIS